MVQVTLPQMSADYKPQQGSKVGGETRNVVGYVTVTFSGNAISLTPVAVTIDKSDFNGWDKLVFNGALLPRIFSTIQSTIPVLHIPDLSWR
jgi:hypothetical protein